MKQCTKCKKFKLEKEFSWRVKGKRRHTICKDCHKIYRRQHYLINRQKYIEKARRNDKKYIERYRKFILKYLNTHPCVDCGEIDIVVLEFDHIDGIKEQAIGELKTYSLKRLKREIKKCEVRCANCHQRRHAKEGNWYRFVPV